ncbi:MAG TPA: enoyl-CoA hydratase/isomerase family protein [Flavitalea sp.]|nr:enoyl-CoA hydratase/isomerase family protein [Flavitalea sp.]
MTSSNDSGGSVKSVVHHGIRSIEFFHPQSNSLPGSMLREIARQFHIAAEDPETFVIVLRSGGDSTFCSGASFDELASITNEQEGIRFFSGFAQVINAMRICPQLVIARIHGKCVGGGVGLAAAADYAIAVEGADIKLSELAVGIGPFVVGPAVERKIGNASFSQLAIDAMRWRNAEWAKRKGLYAELHPTMDDMEEGIKRLSESLAHSNPAAMREMKKIFWKGTEHWEQMLTERAAISGRLILSDFSRKALQRFKK